jgi:hypothetical protein
MKGFLIMLGVAILVISLVGGSIYLSGSYHNYESRLREMGAQPGSSVTLFDQTKWQLAQFVGVGTIFGGLIFGSMLIGLGWIGKTLEQVRDLLSGEAAAQEATLEAPSRSQEAPAAAFSREHVGQTQRT